MKLLTWGSCARPRPVFYRTRRSLVRRAMPVVAAAAILAVVGAIALGAALLIARLQATQAQLDAVHLAGVAIGQTMCGRQ